MRIIRQSSPKMKRFAPQDGWERSPSHFLVRPQLPSFFPKGARIHSKCGSPCSAKVNSGLNYCGILIIPAMAKINCILLLYSKNQVTL